ncbi:MAG: TetR family transcriptional regulator [Candidatus Methanomethylophilaceae archaeon]|nr:TetR family transcriptional regulator [Candidatus Methanomethylophilaceae archaeon]
MDRRQVKTRKAVFEAFVGLLEEKGYPDITVQDIIDRADIGRSTFYSHFEVKEDLLNVLCEEIFAHAFSKHPAKEVTHDFSERDGFKDELTHILYHMRDSRDYIRSILSSESGDVFMRYFKDHLREVFGRCRPAVPDGVPGDYAMEHSVCWFAETVRWWMDNEGYSPEEVMGLFCRYCQLQRP